MFESSNSPPLINTPAPQVSIQYQWPCDNCEKHKDQWCPPRYAPPRGDVPSREWEKHIPPKREVGWRSSSTPKNHGIFFGMGGMLVWEEGENLVFLLNCINRLQLGGFNQKKHLFARHWLASSLRERIFGGDFLKQKKLQKKTHPEGAKNPPCLRWGKTSCKWSLDN